MLNLPNLHPLLFSPDRDRSHGRATSERVSRIHLEEMLIRELKLSCGERVETTFARQQNSHGKEQKFPRVRAKTPTRRSF